MIQIRRITTRKFDGTDLRDGSCFTDMRDIDEALGLILFSQGKPSRYNGPVETVWNKGGLRRPQVSGWDNSARKNVISKTLKMYVPDNFSGIAIFYLNNGELWGNGPKIIPA